MNKFFMLAVGAEYMQTGSERLHRSTSRLSRPVVSEKRRERFAVIRVLFIANNSQSNAVLAHSS
jgi:hypothetical protein